MDTLHELGKLLQYSPKHSTLFKDIRGEISSFGCQYHSHSSNQLFEQLYSMLAVFVLLSSFVTCRFGARTCEHVKHVMKLVARL